MLPLSIVTTIYNSSSFIEEFHTRISTTIDRMGIPDYEIIFVNDGSPDDSLNKLIPLAKQDRHTKIIELSRNFGHHKAMMSGMTYATGNRVFLIDVDLEESPECLELFWQHMTGDTDVVFGVQAKRKGGFSERFFGALFYRIFNWMSPTKVVADFVTARLMTKQYVEQLLAYRERELFIGGLWSDAGFNQVPVIVEKASRTHHSTYSFWKRLKLMVNAITSFSNRPLIIIAVTGFLITLGAFLYSAWLIYNKFAGNQVLSGWTSMAVAIWFNSGLILLSLGIVGIYIAKIFVEVKQRPYAIVRRVYGFADDTITF